MELPDITTLTEDDGFYVNSDGLSKAAYYPVLRDQIRAGGVGSATLGLGPGKLNQFVLSIRNSGGTLQYSINGLGIAASGYNAHYTTAINGATATYNTTPTGSDSSTPFTTGIKVSSADPNRVFFNTADIVPATDKPVMMACITYNSTGTLIYTVAEM